MIPFGLTPLRAYAYAGALLAFVAVLTFAGCEHRAAEQARDAKASAEAQRDAAIDANQASGVTIESLNQALQKWRELGVTTEEAESALAALRTRNEQIAALTANIEKLKERDRANPSCNALLRVDLDRVCPDIALGLRSAAGSYAVRKR